MRTKLCILAAALLLAAVYHALMRPGADPLDAFPHAFLAAPGYDPAAVVTVVSPVHLPPPPPPGTLPAWECADPAFADAQGRPWLMPVAVAGDRPVLPQHPGLRRRPAPESCRIHYTAEARRLLGAFREGRGP